MSMEYIFDDFDREKAEIEAGSYAEFVSAIRGVVDVTPAQWADIWGHVRCLHTSHHAVRERMLACGYPEATCPPVVPEE